MKLIARSNIYQPLLQRANYSPLPVRPKKPRSKRVIRNEGSNLKVDRPVDSGSWTPLWNQLKSSPTSNYSWTNYESIPSKAPSKDWPGRSEQELTGPSSPIIVQVPQNPDGILQPDHPAAQLLSHSALVVVRQLEMMNLFIGFEQANRYRILSPTGDTVGYLAEEERGLSGTLFRQLAGTHRAFQASIMNQDGQEVLRIRRPFSFINSRILIQTVQSGSYDTDVAHDYPSQTEVVGEAQQEFHLWRRKYNLFTRLNSHTINPTTRSDLSSSSTSGEDMYEQFARIDAGFLSWDFYAQDREARLTGSISRNFTGFGREIFTDTGQYVVRFDAIESQVDSIQNSHHHNPSPSFTFPPHVSSQSLNSLPSTEVCPTGLTLDQRAVMLATAVSIDFDYFSRTHRGGLMPPIFFGGGSSSEDL